MQVMPWILDVSYTVVGVALMLAAMGHLLFGDFEITMVTMSDSISGKRISGRRSGAKLCSSTFTSASISMQTHQPTIQPHV